MHGQRLSRLAAALLMVWAPSAFAPSVAAAPSSSYTEHRYDACPKGPSPEPGVIDVRVCAGPAGLPVTLVAEPDAATLRIGRAPLDEPLGIGSFYEPSSKIEWVDLDGSPGPAAAIVRYKVGPSVGALKDSRLVVYRLEPSGRSCVMAAIREPGANDRARAIVERSAAGFRCGSSARIGG
ncbi:MAG: hypothetical protein DI565_02315 [Ancylobacter novellus]|uniref:Uncharacterized protein n=1 Tax=Ancylobacter novellus TaxID=921 RepID=A0A2W5KSW9_ANCNO|nr:MAG: hypothetical protein DI565_02315 [Ancylobacter novellus]